MTSIRRSPGVASIGMKAIVPAPIAESRPRARATGIHATTVVHARALAALATVTLVSLVLATGQEGTAFAECTPASTAPIATWGVVPPAPAAPSPANVAPTLVTQGPIEEASPVHRARDLLERAKVLEESAAVDDRAATTLTQRLPSLTNAAKVARDRASRAPTDPTLGAQAETLEADVAVTEAEIASHRSAAAEHRRLARDLRSRALRLVKDPPVVVETSCDPPYRFTADGRKSYRLECLR